MKLPATPEKLYKRLNDFYRPLLEAATTRFPHSLPGASSFHRNSSDPPILIEAVAVNGTRFGAVPSSQKQDDIHPGAPAASNHLATLPINTNAQPRREREALV